MLVKNWAAKWSDGRIHLVLFTDDRKKVDLKAAASAIALIVRDLNETDTAGDEHHTLTMDYTRIHLSRKEALSLRTGLTQLLELGEKGSPFVGVSSEGLRLRREATTRIITPTTSRWV